MKRPHSTIPGKRPFLVHQDALCVILSATPSRAGVASRAFGGSSAPLDPPAFALLSRVSVMGGGLSAVMAGSEGICEKEMEAAPAVSESRPVSLEFREVSS